MKKTTPLFIILGSVFVGISLISCGFGQESTKSEESLARVETKSLPVAWTITATMKTSTKSLSSTPSPSTIPHKTPTLTDTPTLESTHTPIPTNELYNYSIEQLMRTNGNCRLPCWWGIKPGITLWDEAKQFLEHIGLVEKSGAASRPPIEEYVVWYWNPGTDDSNATHIEVINGIVHRIGVAPETSRYIFSLNRILSDYGVPSEILFHQRKTILDSISYKVGLVYWDDNFFVEYIFGTESPEDPFTVCHYFGPTLRTWSSEHSWDIEDIHDRIKTLSGKPINSIDEVTDLTTAEFYSLFRHYSPNPCLSLTN